MLLTPEEIKQQTRQLWHTCFPNDSEDFLDLYFEDRYTDQRNVTIRKNAKVVAATQVLPFKFHFAGHFISVGYVSGLCTAPKQRGKGYATQALKEAHRKMYDEGALISFLIPGDEHLRKFYESEDHGAYYTATHRLAIDVMPDGTIKSNPNPKIDIQAEYEWGRDLWTYYNTFGGRHPYEIKLDEDAFFAAIQTHDLNDGLVIVARRRGKIVGFCLALREGKPLKSGKRSAKTFQGCIRFLLTTDEQIMQQLQARAFQLLDVKEMVMVGGCPARGFKGAEPYAMARIINVEKFLTFIGRLYPGLQLHVGIQNDHDIPENNGFYQLIDGRLHITDQKPDSITTPGGLAAVFLAAQPVLMPMLLDD